MFSEAKYFCMVDLYKAYIPSSYALAYNAQPNEDLAEREGIKISSAIEALSVDLT